MGQSESSFIHSAEMRIITTPPVQRNDIVIITQKSNNKNTPAPTPIGMGGTK